jgi:hypothetical protein
VTALTDLPLAAKAALWGVLAFSVWRGISIHALRRGERAVMALTLRSDGKLEIEVRSGERIEVQVDGRSTVFSWLVVLLLKREGRTEALTLPHDALGSSAHRLLRLWLRWRSTVPSAG